MARVPRGRRALRTPGRRRYLPSMKHRMSSALPLFFSLTSVLAIAACSSDSTQTTTSTGTGGSTGSGEMTTSSVGGGTSASTGTSTGATGTGGAEVACMGSDFSDPNAAKLMIGTISAKIVDLAGQPVPKDLSAQVCGTDICITGVTNALGSVTEQVNQNLVKPAFKYGDARTFAKMLIPVKAGSTDFGVLTTAALPVAGVDFAPGKTMVSGDVTIEIAATGVAEVDALNYPEVVDQQLRAVTIPVDKVPGVLAGAPTIAQLYGVAPVDTVFCPPAKVTVPNADPVKLPAGTDVEFLILNVETIEAWGPYGEWQKVSDGKVSADGKTISTTEGLPVLHLFGVRKKL
jgi:hypothetical protein